MAWYIAASFGALGGLVVSLVALFNDLWAWREARRPYLFWKRSDLPRISQFVDLKPDLLVLLTRIICGSLAGGLVHSEVTGFIPVIAAGAAAPAILSQFGKNVVYSTELELDSSDKEDIGKKAKTSADFNEQTHRKIGTKENANRRGRHAKKTAAHSQRLGSVPRQRVQPDEDVLAQRETE